MKRFITFTMAALAAVSILSISSYAGEFITQSNGRIYYNTGEPDYYRGWKWIMRTDGLARCYYFDDGYVWTSPYTPDGYQINDAGEWVQNGQVVTKSAYEAGMGRETNWLAFDGYYHVRSLQYSDGDIAYYGPAEWPIRVESAQTGFTLVWTGGDGSRQWFTPENTMYSYICSDGTLLDVIDENNFRIIWPDGAIYTVTR